MTESAYLTDDQIERLANLLEQRAVPFRGFNLEALDGYFTALAVSSAELAIEQWEPAIWGKTPRWDEATERADIEDLLLTHRNMALARVRHGNETLPDHLAPLLWLPEDPENPTEGVEAPQEDELDVGRDWALGFFTAVELQEEQWDAWLDENDWMEQIFDLFDRLASGEVIGEEPGQPATPIDYPERLGIIAMLPDMLADLHHHRTDALTPREPIRAPDTPERNEPCPCGSGRKYKKCCGA